MKRLRDRLEAKEKLKAAKQKAAPNCQGNAIEFYCDPKKRSIWGDGNVLQTALEKVEEYEKQLESSPPNAKCA